MAENTPSGSSKKFLENPHSRPKAHVLQSLETDPDTGLSEEEANRRRQIYGSNQLREHRQKSLLQILLDQTSNPVVYLLIAAAAVAFLFGDIPEGIAIVIVLMLNTIIGFSMEYQARQSMDALQSLDKVLATVLRDGNERSINAEELVPGDIVSLEAGDLTPADGRLIAVSELSIDESPLTGESVPVTKRTEPSGEDTPVTEQECMIFKGTAVTNGKGKAVIVSTGMETQIGSISVMVSEEEDDKIPLNRKLENLTRRMIVIVPLLAGTFFVMGWIAGEDLYQLIQTFIAWTVAAIPEGLPIVASIALARGMLRLAEHDIIVKRLAAVETLGETTLIFTDKTGTLTLNRLTLRHLAFDGFGIDVEMREGDQKDRRKVILTAADGTDSGFDSENIFQPNDENTKTGEEKENSDADTTEGNISKLGNPLEDERLKRFFEIAVLCNDGKLNDPETAAETGDEMNENAQYKTGEVDIAAVPTPSEDTESSSTDEFGQSQGDPLDVAMLRFGKALDRDRFDRLQSIERLAEEPFDSEDMVMGTVCEIDGEILLLCKGAPEAIVDRCTGVLSGNVADDVSGGMTDDVSRPGENFNSGTDTDPGGNFGDSPESNSDNDPKLKTEALSGDDKTRWLQHNHQLSEDGLRVIALAYRKLDHRPGEETDVEEGLMKDLILLGLAGFIDPPREEVREAVNACLSAGIKVGMVTGDHPGTARNIARQVHIVNKDNDRALHGRELTKMASEKDKSGITDYIAGTRIFARVDPVQKLELIRHFQDLGEIVAMTGDGVNDAPALKRADIGIAMGKRGTRVAKETADMVLKNDAFSSIEEAIREGRIIFDNIRKFIMYQFSYHLSEIVIIAAVSFTVFRLPLLPLQLLFLNLLSDVFPALALGIGQGDPRIMQRRPKNPEEPIITPQNWFIIALHGLVISIWIIGAYFFASSYWGLSAEVCNNIAFFSLAFTQLLHVFDMREADEALFNNQVTRNLYVWAAIIFCALVIVAAIFINPISEVLAFQELELRIWVLIGITSLLSPVTIQILKELTKNRKFRF